MLQWSPSDWLVWFGGLAGFIAITLVPFLYKMVDIVRQLRSIGAKANEANTKADAAIVSSKDNTDRIISIAQGMPPPGAPLIVASGTAASAVPLEGGTAVLIVSPPVVADRN